jgi:non-heme chloroperoxidase
LDEKPALIGHSTGGLLAQMLAGRGLAAATVAIDPGVFRGALPLPASTLKSLGRFLVNPFYRRRAITLTFDQFKYGWANALDEKEAKELYDTYHIAGSGIALAQMGNANLNPWTEAKVNTKNPDRGPLLIIDGEKDHSVPWAIANAAYKRQRRNPGVTEIVKIPNRGHALTIDHGWREVAQNGARIRQAVRLSGHRPAPTAIQNARHPPLATEVEQLQSGRVAVRSQSRQHDWQETVPTWASSDLATGDRG